MNGNRAGKTFYRLAWPARLKNLGYLILALLLLLWLVYILGPAEAPRMAPVARFFLSLWWLWPALAAVLGFLYLALAGVELSGEGVSMAAAGLRWRVLPWGDVRRARLLKVGGTVAILAETGNGAFRAWQAACLADAGKLAADCERILGGRLDQTLSAPYSARRGTVWTSSGGTIVRTVSGRRSVFDPDSLAGVKFLFLEGEDLPFKVYLFGGTAPRPVAAGRNVRFFPFLAADILRLAQRAGIRAACVELGADRPRPPFGKVEKPRPACPRAWESEGGR